MAERVRLRPAACRPHICGCRGMFPRDGGGAAIFFPRVFESCTVHENPVFFKTRLFVGLDPLLLLTYLMQRADTAAGNAASNTAVSDILEGYILVGPYERIAIEQFSITLLLVK